ncbi:hypothetical protein ANN_19768 [Periplaneta americana]|uniref:Uncharacterized protein n=1 Tax=Periplaneta americana TaxID=6978 RepID=A0ABQ8SAS5_PERAM|nr:hypothetical protein ANN_19768 [Periplaneta americana]
MTPLCTLLKSGSDVLVQTFTVLVYRPSFLDYHAHCSIFDFENTQASQLLCTSSYNTLSSPILFHTTALIVSTGATQPGLQIRSLQRCSIQSFTSELQAVVRDERCGPFLDSRLDDKSFSTE